MKRENMYTDLDFEKSFKQILDFRTKVTLGRWREDPVFEEEVKTVRKHCEILNSQGILSFDLDCSDIELMRQIQSELNKLIDL